MTAETAAAFAGAAWLGVLTSTSPCPLATNLAAVSFLSRRAGSRRLAVAGAVAYAAGRAAAYAAVGLLVAWGLASAPGLSSALQGALGPFVGPLLILAGLIVLGWLRVPLAFGSGGGWGAARLAGCGLAGEFGIGALFALTFCPVSAALFFGALVPLALSGPAPWVLFGVYGVATALPVGVLAVLVAIGANAARGALDKVGEWQGKARAVSGLALILVGLWLTLGGLLG